LSQNENAKKRFNVDSPAFTPLQATTNGAVTPSSRSAAISPKAANAAVFTPQKQRSSESSASTTRTFLYMLISSAATTPHMHTKEPAIDWHSQDFQEFVPQSFEGQQMVRGDISYSSLSCVSVPL
jgi:PAB-dependent poly(A)-specific ribonuclease subunit 3